MNRWECNRTRGGANGGGGCREIPAGLRRILNAWKILSSAEEEYTKKRDRGYSSHKYSEWQIKEKAKHAWEKRPVLILRDQSAGSAVESSMRETAKTVASGCTVYPAPPNPIIFSVQVGFSFPHIALLEMLSSSPILVTENLEIPQESGHFCFFSFEAGRGTHNFCNSRNHCSMGRTQ